ncbi:hypothetical protein [Marinovum sp.]|uniref:Bug family tripartite tricarboxylate transporter substrate binding protein n=1 Tax=Marinovum sp. TaxID=2024839 RepID=UPI002B2754A6|nr:hypothetical protein [Marinovum sp.]
MKLSGIPNAILGVAMAALLGATTSARADEISEFYDGKTIKVIVPAGPASGYDIYARLMAEHFSDHLPGNPTVIVQNMPGAGGAKAARYYATVGQSDGTELLLSPQTIGTDAALGLLGGVVDVANFNWIGRFTTNVPVGVVSSAAGIDSAEALRDGEVVFAGTSARSPTIVFPTAMNAFADTRLKIVSGFDDTRQTFLAMLQGEADGLVLGWAGLKASNQEMLDAGELKVLFQAASTPHPDLTDVPTVVELAQTEAQKKAMRFLASSSGIGRSIAAHPDVPEARVAALRAAFAEMLADPEFLSVAEARGVELVEPTGPEALESLIDDALSVDDAVLDTIRSALGL